MVRRRSTVRFRKGAPRGLHVSVETMFTFRADILGGPDRCGLEAGSGAECSGDVAGQGSVFCSPCHGPGDDERAADGRGDVLPPWLWRCRGGGEGGGGVAAPPGGA